jgi:hypothetical protein
VEALHRAQTRVWAEQARWVREADQRETYLADGHRSTGDQLAERLCLTKGQGRAAAEDALALAALPQVAARVAAGEIGVEQARVAARVAQETPEDQRAGLDALIAQRGAVVDARALRDEIEAWQAKHTPTSLEERERRARARRSLRTWTTKDGMGAGAWRLDPAAHARVATMLEALARPQEGETRTREQRLADALTDAADRVLVDPDAPRAGGLPVRALVIVPEGALRDDPHAEPALLDGYGAICNATARLLVCGADEVVAIRVAFNGAFVDLGYADGKPTPAQRLIVTARDRRCVGCGAAASRCQVHHVVWQSRGGPTVVDNLCLLCWDCHTRVHHHNWDVVRDPDGHFRLRSPLKAALEKRRTA